MNINAKSCIKTKELKGKTDICKNIEVHLSKEYDNFTSTTEQMMDIIKKNENANITCLHSPMDNKSGKFINVEYFGNEEIDYKWKETVKFADKLVKYYGHEINIVVHNTCPYIYYMMMPGLLDRVIEMFKWSLEFPSINFCIENVTPINYNSNLETVRFINGHFDDNVNLVKYLREKLNTNRIRTTLDTCHAITTVRILNKIYKDQPLDVLEKITLDKFFEINKDVIGLIHLADVEDLGFISGQHGILFKEERIPELYNILDIYNKYNYDCDITIEITEKDYVKNENFKKMYPIVKEYFNNKSAT